MAVTINEIVTGGVEGAGIGIAGAGSLVPVQGPTGSTGTSVPNIAALRAYMPNFSTTTVYVEGYTIPGDGGQGVFIWNPTSNIGDDGGTSILPASGGGSPGPNLVLNGNFASGSAHWTVVTDSPTFTGNKVSGPSGSFWQLSQSSITTVLGYDYIVSFTYTIGAGATGQYVTAQFGNQIQGANIAQTSPTVFTFTAIALSTSSFILLSGFADGTAVATITNITVQQAGGGRFLRQIDEPGICIPEWWGAVGNYINDDAPAINSAIGWATAYGSALANGEGVRGLVKLSPGKVYKCNEVLSPINPVAMSMTGLGSVLDFSSVASGTCITILGASVNGANTPYGNSIALLYGFGIKSFPTNHNLIGIGFSGSSGDFVAHLMFEHLFIDGFGIGLNLNGSDVYEITLAQSNIFSCDVCYCMNAPGGDSGEEMIINNCTLFNSGVCIDVAGGIELNVVNSSLDYSGCFIRSANAVIRVWGCHFETSFFGVTPQTYATGNFLAPISCTAGEITITDSDFVWTSGGASPPLFYSGAPYPYGITADDCGYQWNPNSATANLSIVPTGVSLNPSNTWPNIVFSNSNLTATNNDNASFNYGYGYRTYANTGVQLPSGYKLYFNMTVNSIDLTQTFSGLEAGIAALGSSAYLALAFILSGTPGTYAVAGSLVNDSAADGVYSNGISSLFSIPLSNGAVWWFAYDFTAMEFWWSNDNGTHWNNIIEASASPGAGTGGHSMSALNYDIMYPAVAFHSANDSVTLNFNPNLSGVTGLTGFNPWSTAFTIGYGGAVLTHRSKSVYEGWPPLIDATNALNADPTFEASTGTAFLDAWYLSQDTATITSRNTGTNISIVIGTQKPFTGIQELNIAKVGAGVGAAAIMLPCNVRDNHTYGINYAASVNSLGTFNMNVKYAQLICYGVGGVPIFGKQSIVLTTTFTPTTTYESAAVAVIGSPGATFCSPAPPWATHVIYEFDLGSMNAGTLYIDNAQFYRF